MNTSTILLAQKKSKKRTDGLLAELKEHYDEADVVRVDIHTPAVNLSALRKRLGLTQQAFAYAYGLSPQNIRNWEQGIRAPDRAAMLYLAIIEKYPKEVMKVVAEQGFVSHLR